MSIRHIKITEKKIEEKLKNGDGKGEGVNYRPFIRVGDFASAGRVHRILSVDGRLQHFFSDLEKDYYYHLIWQDNVLDIKEQYPLDRAITMTIADTLGIKHPTDPMTGVPIVMTTDFVITTMHDGKHETFARSVKYQADLDKPRVHEKQALEKLYWEIKEVNWKIVTENSFTRERSRNIQFLMNYYQDAVVEGLPTTMLMVLIEKLSILEYAKLSRVCESIDAQFQLQKGKTLGAFYYFAAHKALPVRLESRWNTWRVGEIVDISLGRLLCVDMEKESRILLKTF